MGNYKKVGFSNALFKAFVFICHKKKATPYDISEHLGLSSQTTSDQLRSLSKERLIIKNTKVVPQVYEVDFGFGGVFRYILDLQRDFLFSGDFSNRKATSIFQKVRESELLKNIFKAWLERKCDDIIRDKSSFESRRDFCLTHLLLDELSGDLSRSYPSFRGRAKLKELGVYFEVLSGCVPKTAVGGFAFRKALK